MSRGGAWRPAPPLLARNRPLLALVTAAALTEAVLLGRGEDTIYQSGGIVAALTVAFLLWFWFVVGTLAGATLMGIAAAARRLPRWAAWVLGGSCLAGVAATLLVYCGSWALFLRSGRFASSEVLRFALQNAGTSWLWFYFAQSERRFFVPVVLLLAVLCTGAPRLARATRPPEPLRPPSPGRRWLLWSVEGASTLAMLGLFLFVWHDKTDAWYALQMDALKNRLNPAVTIVASIVESSKRGPILPCLHDAELQPINSNPTPLPSLPADPPSIIFVAVESMRHDIVGLQHQGQDVTPHLNALARAGVAFTRAYAQSTHSDYSDVTVASSLYPVRTPTHYYYRTREPWPKTLIYDLLKPAGYATAIISSQNLDWGGMSRFLSSQNLDLLYDAERSALPTYVSPRDTGFAATVQAGRYRAGSLDDALTIDAAIAWITQQAEQQRPFFLAVDLQDSHFPYDIAPDRPHPFQPATIDFDASFLDYPVEKTDVVRNAYYNALHESDWHLGRLVDALRRLGRLDNTILVVYGENGEAFHESGSVTHAREPVEPAIHIGCVMHAPRQLVPRVEDYPFELIDITPTVLALLGWPTHPNFQGINALAPDRIAAGERLVFVHVENPLASADAVLVGGRWKLQHDRDGRLKLFDLRMDPGEAHNLKDAQPVLVARLLAVLTAWRNRQLAYYHYPFYYERFYPPPAPRWQAGEAANVATLPR